MKSLEERARALQGLCTCSGRAEAEQTILQALRDARREGYQIALKMAKSPPRLLPCPHCGKLSETQQEVYKRDPKEPGNGVWLFRAGCPRCQIWTPLSDRARAEELWNRRAVPESVVPPMLPPLTGGFIL